MMNIYTNARRIFSQSSQKSKCVKKCDKINFLVTIMFIHFLIIKIIHEVLYNITYYCKRREHMV